jgi:hypothetical protein
MAAKKRRRRREKPLLVRRAAPGEKCPVCKGKKPGTFYGIYERLVWNSKKPEYRYKALYCGHGKGSKSNGNGSRTHIIDWCYMKGSCRREPPA